MDATTLVREELEADRLTADLVNRFQNVSPDVIESRVREEFDRWQGVPVRDFVPIFVERALRGKLRNGEGTIGSPPDLT
jgi:hypothetical protein